MLKISFYIAIFISFLANDLQSQSKSEVKENKIKSITVYENKQDSKNGEQIESVVVYDKNGNIVEEKEYNDDGELKKHFKYEYDNLSRKTKETEYDKNGDILETKVYTYDGKLKKERTTYDSKGRIKNKQRYVYTKHE